MQLTKKYLSENEVMEFRASFARPMLSGRAVGLVNLHVLIDRERGIANGRTCGGWSVAGRGAKVASGTLDRIGVTVSLGPRHGQRIGRNEFVQSRAMPVLRDVAALRLGNLQKISANAGEAYGLRWRGAFVSDRHFFEVEMIDAKQKRCGDENRDEGTHRGSLALSRTACKTGAKNACARKQQNSSSTGTPASLLDFSYRLSLLAVQNPSLGLTNELVCAFYRAAGARKIT